MLHVLGLLGQHVTSRNQNLLQLLFKKMPQYVVVCLYAGDDFICSWVTWAHIWTQQSAGVGTVSMATESEAMIRKTWRAACFNG